jgi:aryl-phospho-beta-D-glucosidase BglC (GH1 family)
VLALNETADYLKFILNRYDGDTALGKSVIAIDLVNEPHADGTTAPARLQKLVDTVYAPWLAARGPKSLRAVDADKPLIITPTTGSGSMVGVDMTSVAKPNVILTFHDYFGQALGTDPTHGLGYDKYGWSTAMEATDQTTSAGLGGTYVPYDPANKSYSARYSEHRTYIENAVNAAKRWKLPLYIGEYGIANPCNGGNHAATSRYFADTTKIYDEFGLSRTVWANGYWDDMAVMWRENGTCSGTAKWDYFDYASVITGGQTY